MCSLRRFVTAFYFAFLQKGMKNNKKITTIICRAGIIGALYAVLTMCFAPVAFGPFQIRPSEVLTVLPLIFPEAIAGLYVGCILSNVLSLYGVLDVLLGSLATLIAAVTTYFIGKLFKSTAVKALLGGLPPVIVNAFAVPAIWLLAGSDVAYWLEVAFMLLNEGVWVYVLGVPTYVLLHKIVMKNKKNK